MADFRETYRLNLWELPLDDDDMDGGVLARTAALAFQLPRTGRTMRRLVPTSGNDMSLQLLRSIEFDARYIIWLLGKCKGKEPDPIDLYGEEELERARARTQASRAPSVAAALGIPNQATGSNPAEEVDSG